MKNTTLKKVNVTPSSGNVFEDLGLPDVEDRLLKAQLALKIRNSSNRKR